MHHVAADEPLLTGGAGRTLCRDQENALLH